MPSKQAELLESVPPERGALVKADDFVSMVERLAANKDVDVDKLQKILDMQERILRVNAKSAFDAAFSIMQSELPEIAENGKILNRDGTARSRYAKLEDIQEAIKPVLKAHGFAIRHRTEWPENKPNILRIVGILSHREGHSEESTFEAPADKSDYRTDIQSMGSTVSYGRRYTTLDLLNITTRGLDNDGQNQTRQEVVAPEGFENWWIDLTAVADEGTARLQKVWESSKPQYRNHVMKTNSAGWMELKKKAALVK